MFKNKHLIVASSNNIFTRLYIDMLINTIGVDAKKLSFISLDDGIHSDIVHEYSIFCNYYKNNTVEELSKAKTITFMSLHKFNSPMIKDLLDFDENLTQKIYIHSSEDELNRWVLTKQKYGKLVSTKKNLVGDTCLSVLPRLTNFITAQAFRKEMEYVLERKDFTIINARDAFSVMPVQVLTKFQKLYQETSTNTAPDKKILIGVKRNVFSLFEVISILKNMEKQGIITKYKYMIFSYKNRLYFRILLDMYSLYLRHIKKKIVDISYPTVTNSVTYNSLIASCSDIILQKRGSMTTVKEFIRMGRGIVHVKEGTRNELELTQTIGVDVVKYTSFSNLAKNIKMNTVDIQENKTAL